MVNPSSIFAAKVDDIRQLESKEINELIQLSKKNEENMPVDINDMTDLSEILVVKERRKSRDERRKSGNGSPKRV